METWGTNECLGNRKCPRECEPSAKHCETKIVRSEYLVWAYTGRSICNISCSTRTKISSGHRLKLLLGPTEHMEAACFSYRILHSRYEPIYNFIPFIPSSAFAFHSSRHLVNGGLPSTTSPTLHIMRRRSVSSSTSLSGQIT